MAVGDEGFQKVREAREKENQEKKSQEKRYGARKHPATCEQEKAEKLVSVCREILLNARNELYLNLRFMDAP